MTPAFHRPSFTPEDRRFHGLWTALAVAALLAVSWAAHQTVGETQVELQPVPRRILLLLEPPEEEARSRAQARRQGGRGQPVPAPTGRTVDDGPAGTEPGEGELFQRFFEHEVFGGPDTQLDELARALERPQGLDPHDAGLAVEGVASGVDDELRGDAEVGPIARVARSPVRLVHPESRAPQRASLAPAALQRVPELPSRAVEAGVRRWRRHAAVCHATHAPDFSGRVELRTWVVSGRVERVEVRLPEADGALSELSDCLSLRARALLSFGLEHTGEARLPLVFEAR